MTALLDPPVKSFPAFGRWLWRAMAAQPEKLTWKVLAEKSGLSYSYLIQLKNGHERPTRRAIARLEAALGLPFQETAALGSEVEETAGVVLLPVLEALAAPPWLRDLGLREPVAVEQLPGPDAFFVLQPDAGLMPSIPAQALCLTDPRQRHLPATPAPLLIRREGQAPVGRWVWRSPLGVQVATGALHAAVSPGPTPEPPEAIEVLGRLVAVRYRLAASGLQAPTFV